MTARRRAEIAGAGLAGLTAAAALAQRGWSVRVHEQGHDLREIGAGIYLAENGLLALDAVGAFDDVAARGELVGIGELRDHQNRIVRLRHRQASGRRFYIALRRDLHNALARAATNAGAEIVTGSRVLAAAPDGRVELDGGFGERADLVVGADGVYSSVRDSLGLATAITDLQDGCGRHLIPRTSDDPVGRTIEAWSGGRRLGVAPASENSVYLFLCCPEADVEGRLQQPFDAAPWIRSHPWYRSQIQRIPRHPEQRWLAFYDVRCRAWSAGRVALVGDAAHSMSPNLGQGACVAMANAVALADAVATADDVPGALQRWEARERPVVEQAQRYSRLYGAVGTRWPTSKPLLDLRSSVVSSLLLPLLEPRLSRIIDHAEAASRRRG